MLYLIKHICEPPDSEPPDSGPPDSGFPIQRRKWWRNFYNVESGGDFFIVGMVFIFFVFISLTPIISITHFYLFWLCTHPVLFTSSWQLEQSLQPAHSVQLMQLRQSVQSKQLMQ